MDRKKLGSFRVPLVSDLSLGFSPGTLGALPVNQIVGSAARAGDEEESRAAVPSTAAALKKARRPVGVSANSATVADGREGAN